MSEARLEEAQNKLYSDLSVLIDPPGLASHL